MQVTTFAIRKIEIIGKSKLRMLSAVVELMLNARALILEMTQRAVSFTEIW